MAPMAGEVVSQMVSKTASAAVGSAMQGLTAAAATVPGAGALAAGAPALGAAGVLGAEAAGWYAGKVTEGVVGSAEQFGRDMLAIPMSQLSALVEPVMPVVGKAQAGIEAALNSAEMIPAHISSAASNTAGGDTYQFISHNEEAMFSRYRLERAKQNRGKVGAR